MENMKKHLGLQLMQTDWGFSLLPDEELKWTCFCYFFPAPWKSFILKTFYLFCLRIPELVPELMLSIVLSFDI